MLRRGEIQKAKAEKTCRKTKAGIGVPKESSFMREPSTLEEALGEPMLKKFPNPRVELSW